MKLSSENKKDNICKNKNAKNITLGIIFASLIIALTVFITLFFTGNRKDNNNNTDSSSTVSSETSETSEDIPSTTNQNHDYIGIWRMEGFDDQEITIYSIDASTVSFSLWFYRIWASDTITTTLDKNVARFENKEIAGTLTFDDDSITLDITMSSIPGVPSNITELFDVHLGDLTQNNDVSNNTEQYADIQQNDDMTQGNSSASSFNPYMIKVNNPRLRIYDNPSYSANVVGEITNQSRYTIVEEHYDKTSKSTWGRLKSGAGWINLAEAMQDLDEPTETTAVSDEGVTTEIDSGTEYTTETISDAQSDVSWNVERKNVNGIEFNYVSQYYRSAKDEDDLTDINVQVDIEYCEPSKYMNGDEYITSIYRRNYVYNEDEIGSVYYSAGTDDFKIFKIHVKGNRHESYHGDEFYSKATIDYERYNSYGTLLSNGVTGITQYDVYTGELNVPDIDETFYIGLYSSEVARIDLIVFGFKPEDFKKDN